MNRIPSFPALAVFNRLGLCLALALLSWLPLVHGQTTPAFSNLVIFGDSLSDVDNVANATNDKFGVRYPGENFNYATGRFTDGLNSSPSASAYTGVWHEQLARTFFNITRPTASTDGGLDYAYGGATTEDGTKTVTATSGPIPFSGGDFSITIRNLGQQVTDYLARSTPPDPAALHIVWGGGNDLFNDSSATNVTATATRVTALVERLARAGAANVLVPNVPPLGAIPNYAGQPDKAAALNQASADYRDQLNANLNALQTRLAGAGVTLRLYRLDIYDLFLGLVQNPAAFGFTNVTQSAQNRNVRADDYLFWDNIHPTTAGHHQIAAEAFAVLTRPAFFNGETTLNNGVNFLQFSNGTPFGYYSYLADPHYFFHFDLGYEYLFDANDGQRGVYLYDFASNGYFYTSPSFPFPYLYDFSLNAVLYYYPQPGSPGRYTSNPRYFFNFKTGQILSK